jgi:glutamine phosphoribosylpyrophosphate amidotransferase
MCAIIGVSLLNPSSADFDLVRKVFIESKIRGMHATGMTVLYKNKLKTFIETVPADKFTELNNLEKYSDGELKLIGHCRYSTSDLEYNQPLYTQEVSIVHNGVISQELPEKWKDLYEINTKTKNDSELLLHTVNDSPLVLWANASIAAVELHRSGLIRYYRNGKRPLYKAELENGFILTSTADIMRRASSGKYTSKPIPCGVKSKDYQMEYVNEI